MKKKVSMLLAALLLTGGIIVFGGEKPQPELVKATVIQQA